MVYSPPQSDQPPCVSCIPTNFQANRANNTVPLLLDSAAILSRMEEDPFYDVKHQVTITFSQLQPEVDQYVSMQATALNDNRTKQLGRNIKTKLSTIQTLLDDLQETVSIVKSNRATFAQINDQELASRQNFIDERRKQLAQVKTTLQSVKPARRATEDQRATLTGASTRRTPLDESSHSSASAPRQPGEKQTYSQMLRL